jgi:hypothetical protein
MVSPAGRDASSPLYWRSMAQLPTGCAPRSTSPRHGSPPGSSKRRGLQGALEAVAGPSMKPIPGRPASGTTATYFKGTGARSHRSPPNLALV